MPAQLVLPIEDTSHVGNARRAATELASRLGFDEEQSGKLALAVTEASTNILKHAQRGKVLLRPVNGKGNPVGIEMLALDRGPGISNLATSLRDGHSTAGTAGTGLGALARLSPTFDIYSQPSKGTALRLVLRAGGEPRKPVESQTRSTVEIGAVCVAKSGEPVSGDEWDYVHSGRYFTIMVADGLGHGVDAFKASRSATNVLHTSPDAAPQAILENAHGALMSTRGAAVAVARLEPGNELGSFAGIGNIVARVEQGPTRHLVSHNGTVGHNVRRIQEFVFPWPAQSLLILHSDGVGTHWHLADYPGLATKHPGLIAGVLYRDFERGRDDATVVVLRNGASH